MSIPSHLVKRAAIRNLLEEKQGIPKRPTVITVIHNLQDAMVEVIHLVNQVAEVIRPVNLVVVVILHDNKAVVDIPRDNLAAVDIPLANKRAATPSDLPEIKADLDNYPATDPARHPIIANQALFPLQVHAPLISHAPLVLDLQLLVWAAHIVLKQDALCRQKNLLAQKTLAAKENQSRVSEKNHAKHHKKISASTNLLKKWKTKALMLETDKVFAQIEKNRLGENDAHYKKCVHYSKKRSFVPNL